MEGGGALALRSVSTIKKGTSRLNLQWNEPFLEVSTATLSIKTLYALRYNLQPLP